MNTYTDREILRAQSAYEAALRVGNIPGMNRARDRYEALQKALRSRGTTKRSLLETEAQLRRATTVKMGRVAA